MLQHCARTVGQRAARPLLRLRTAAVLQRLMAARYLGMLRAAEYNGSQRLRNSPLLSVVYQQVSCLLETDISFNLIRYCLRSQVTYTSHNSTSTQHSTAHASSKVRSCGNEFIYRMFNLKVVRIRVCSMRGLHARICNSLESFVLHVASNFSCCSTVDDVVLRRSHYTLHPQKLVTSNC
jgi:hypothetical protein